MNKFVLGTSFLELRAANAKLEAPDLLARPILVRLVKKELSPPPDPRAAQLVTPARFLVEEKINFMKKHFRVLREHKI